MCNSVPVPHGGDWRAEERQLLQWEDMPVGPVGPVKPVAPVGPVKFRRCQLLCCGNNATHQVKHLIVSLLLMRHFGRCTLISASRQHAELGGHTWWSCVSSEARGSGGT